MQQTTNLQLPELETLGRNPAVAEFI